jgi:menaquinone-dependent protoporphyrinogen IX oxidase
LLDDVDFIFPRARRAAESGDKELQQLSNVFAENILAAFFTATTLHVFARRTAYNTGYMAMFGISLTADIAAAGNSEDRIKKTQESLKKTINETEWGKKLEAVAEGTAREYLTAFINDNAGRQAVSQIML